MEPPPPPAAVPVIEAHAGAFDMGDLALPPPPGADRTGPAIVGGWTLPPPPPTPRTVATPREGKAAAPPSAMPVIHARDHATLAAALEAAAAKGRQCAVAVEGGAAYEEKVTVPAGVTLRGPLVPGEAPPSVKAVTLAGNGSAVEGFKVADGVRVLREAKNCRVVRCSVVCDCDTGIETRGANTRIEGCAVSGCEDGIKGLGGGGLEVADTAVSDCECDGVFSVSRIKLLARVTFANIERHEVNCAAGVEKTVAAPVVAAEDAAEEACPSPARDSEPAVASPPKIPDVGMGWRGEEWVASPAFIKTPRGD